ncbi:hypothetical protein [Acinetobacter larvae]|nr:hypothetical protein [Acinetobacter larvae]
MLSSQLSRYTFCFFFIFCCWCMNKPPKVHGAEIQQVAQVQQIDTAAQ